MMNKLYKIALGFIISISFVACNDNEVDGVAFSLDKNEITLGAEGGTDIVLIESNDNWTVSATVPWLSVSPASGVGNAACRVAVDSSLVNDMRTAEIRFAPATLPSMSVTVKQMGYDKKIVPESDEITIESSAKMEERYFETTVTTNVKFSVVVDLLGAEQKWLTSESVSIDLDKGARPRTAKLRFDWKMNKDPESRVAEIRLIPVGDGAEEVDTAVISVMQKPAIKIEDNRAGDSITLVLMYELMNCWNNPWDTSENMQYWDGVELWEAGDKDLPAPEAVGRVRAVQYSFLVTKETIPAEIRHLKYLESLDISSNSSTMNLDIRLGSEICGLKHLKYLRMFSYGLVSLPDDFNRLGETLVALDLSANNFTEIPAILTPENFPKLKSLNLLGSRRWHTTDLRNKEEYKSKGGIGLNIDASTDNAFRRLLLWENLEELSFSNCYIEGQIPDFKVGEDSVVAYTTADITALNDSIKDYTVDYLLGKPKILPNCTMLRLNLNFLTGSLPDWLLYHPHFIDWVPELLIFNQQENGFNTAGERARFDNVPLTFDYYYDAFPGARAKYELKEEITEE